MVKQQTDIHPKWDLQYHIVKLQLIKEAMRLAQEPHQKVFIAIHDEETGHLAQYNSDQAFLTPNKVANIFKKYMKKQRAARRRGRRTLRVMQIKDSELEPDQPMPPSSFSLDCNLGNITDPGGTDRHEWPLKSTERAESSPDTSTPVHSMPRVDPDSRPP